MAVRARSWAASVNRTALWLTVTLLGFYAVIVLLTTASSSHVLDGSIYLLSLLAISALGYAPAILLHELGHALATVLCGWRVWIISVGPIELRLVPHAAVHMRSGVGHDAGGYVLPAPSTLERATRLRSALITAGGPIASVAGAAFCFALAAPLLEYEQGWPKFWGGLIYAFGVTNIVSAILTLWPHRSSKGRGNDIVNIIDKLSRPPDARNELWLHALGVIEYGFSPDHWPAALKRQLRQPQSAETSLGLAAAFLDALARDDFERAGALAAAPLPTGKTASVLFYLRAWFEACERGDFAAADAALASARVDFAAAWVMKLRELALIGVLAADGETIWARQRFYQMRERLRPNTPTNVIMRRVVERAQEGPLGDALFPERAT